MRTLLTIFIALFCYHGIAANIINNGKSDYSIVISPSAVITEKTAARELSSYLKKMTGVTLPVVVKDDYKGPAILIGQTSQIAKMLNIDFKKFETR